jgi:hypothetical protein
MGRVQRLVQRALVRAGGGPVQARELVRRHGWSWSIYRVLYQYAVRDSLGLVAPERRLDEAHCWRCLALPRQRGLNEIR